MKYALKYTKDLFQCIEIIRQKLNHILKIRMVDLNERYP